MYKYIKWQKWQNIAFKVLLRPFLTKDKKWQNKTKCIILYHCTIITLTIPALNNTSFTEN